MPCLVAVAALFITHVLEGSNATSSFVVIDVGSEACNPTVVELILVGVLAVLGGALGAGFNASVLTMGRKRKLFRNKLAAKGGCRSSWFMLRFALPLLELVFVLVLTNSVTYLVVQLDVTMNCQPMTIGSLVYGKVAVMASYLLSALQEPSDVFVSLGSIRWLS